MKIQARFLLAGAMSLCAFIAQAQSATPETAALSQADAPSASQATASDDPHCLRYTGSLIVATRNAREDAKRGGDDASKQDRCIYGSGRSYTQDDIRRTGQSDIGHALQMLDPSVSLGY